MIDVLEFVNYQISEASVDYMVYSSKAVSMS